MARPTKQLYDMKFGRWTVVDFSHRNERGSAFWLCRCECGKEKTIYGSELVMFANAGSLLSARKMFLPMRPNPLIPTLIAISRHSSYKVTISWFGKNPPKIGRSDAVHAPVPCPAWPDKSCTAVALLAVFFPA